MVPSGARAAAVRRTLSAPPAGAPRLLRPAAARGKGPAGGAGPRPRHPRLLLLLLLVRHQDPARATPDRDAHERRARSSFLPLLGQRELDAALGRRRTGAAYRATLWPRA